ncbi:MAG: hypothetical protein JSV78_12045 [Phycisphaerales bacterium]|nr:MAG: hypothetical protein JSV78_12045 [Phycisphaerales bacterium]
MSMQVGDSGIQAMPIVRPNHAATEAAGVATPVAGHQQPIEAPVAQQTEERPSAALTAPQVDTFSDEANTKLDAGVQGLFTDLFTDLAQIRPSFDGLMQTVFGDEHDRAQAESYRQQALEGNYSWLPSFEFIDGETLKSANGAYDSEAGLVYINSGLRENTDLAARTYIEEVGHHLDFQLNEKDAVGDEGELFRRLLTGEKLSDAQIAEIRGENDAGVIEVEGEERKVEFWGAMRPVFTKARHYGDQIRYVVRWVVDHHKSEIERREKRKKIKPKPWGIGRAFWQSIGKARLTRSEERIQRATRAGQTQTHARRRPDETL